MPGQRTVLVADDNAAICDLVKAALEGENLKVVRAADGEEAVRLTRQVRPAAVILDLLMPKLDGISALLRLRADPVTRSTPVLMISGMPGKDAERLAAAYGAVRFLTKPFQLLDLLGAVEEMLAGRAVAAAGAP